MSQTLNDGRKNVPFSLPGDEEEDDVFSSVEVQRPASNTGVGAGDSDVMTSSPISGAQQAVTGPPPAGQPSVQANRTSQALKAAPPRGGSPKPPSGPAPGRAPKPAPPSLTVETSGQPGSRAVDISSAVFSIGRGDADLDIKDEYVSPFHAQIRLKDGAAFLQDLGSKNGVFLRIADELQLEDWDEIVLGTQRFVFRATWDPAPQPIGPYARVTPAVGGNLPSDPARLMQLYAGDQLGGIWRLRDRVTIGRRNADIREPDDPWLSDPHATIERRNNKFFIKDAESQHGTFVRMLDSVELIDGDVFMIGRSRIKISYP